MIENTKNNYINPNERLFSIYRSNKIVLFLFVNKVTEQREK